MRLIDADTLPVHHGIDVGSNYGGLRTIIFKRDIDNALIIDAVPVVRCQDCKWWTKQKASLQGRCDAYSMYPTGEWYCARGERR